MNKFIKKLLVIFFACAVTFTSSCAKNASDYVDYSAGVFSNLTFSLSIRGVKGNSAYNEMTKFLTEVDSEMSLTKNSVIKRFNSLAVGEEIEISSSLYELLSLAEQYRIETNGAFNVAIYPLVQAWHVSSQDMDVISGLRVPQSLPLFDEVVELNELSQAPAYSLRDSDGKYYAKKIVSRAQIDVGAIAKGYVADKCAQIAYSHGATSGIIDISGNVVTIGKWYKNGESNDFIIGVTSPRPRNGGGVICAVKTTSQKASFVTSGDYQRYYEYSYGDSVVNIPHIITKSGLPLGVAYNETTQKYYNLNDYVISATVMCDSSTYADALATASCAVSINEAIEILRGANVSAILFTADKKMYAINLGDDFLYDLANIDDYDGYLEYTLTNI